MLLIAVFPLFVGAADAIFLADRAFPDMGRVGIAVKDGRIVHVGDASRAKAALGPHAAITDFGDATLYPGYCDAHLHLAELGRSGRQVRLEGATSEKDALVRVRAFAATHPDAAVLRGGGWDQNLWPGAKLPSRASLDSIKQPVVLFRIDGHALWCNSAAWGLANVDGRQKDPAGGRIERQKNGSASGVLVDAAMDLVLRHLPVPTALELEADLQAGEARARRRPHRCARHGCRWRHIGGLPRARREQTPEAACVRGAHPFASTVRLPMTRLATSDATTAGAANLAALGCQDLGLKNRILVSP